MPRWAQRGAAAYGDLLWWTNIAMIVGAVFKVLHIPLWLQVGIATLWLVVRKPAKRSRIQDTLREYPGS